MQDNIFLHADILLDHAYKGIASVEWNDAMKFSFSICLNNVI